MKITEKTFDISTGEETIIERDETALEKEERLERNKALAKEAALQAEAEAAKEAATAKLATLGLTTDDLKALGL
jgi:hypothetical protein